MKKIVKIRNKGYTRKKVISISLDSDLIEWLDKTAENIGSDRSKVISFALEQAKNWEDILPDLLKSLQHLGLKPSKRMKKKLREQPGS